MRNAEGVDKLLVSWQSPISNRNYFVGVLEKEHGVYKFRYIEDLVKEAEKEGFTLFIGLKDLNKVYKSNKLFSVFERRLPNRNRNIFKKLIQEYQLEDSEDVDWEYLRITKGRLATDTLSFLEPIKICQDTLCYQGEVAGWTFTKDNNREFSKGDQFLLRMEPNNEKDFEAVEIIDLKNNFERVGYISRPFNKVFFHLLKIGYKIKAKVSSVEEESKRPTISIREKINPEHIKDSFQDYLNLK